jgi:hypothetical protein
VQQQWLAGSAAVVRSQSAPSDELGQQQKDAVGCQAMEHAVRHMRNCAFRDAVEERPARWHAGGCMKPSAADAADFVFAPRR